MNKDYIKKELELKTKNDWYMVKSIDVSFFEETNEIEIIFWTDKHWTNGSYYYSYKGNQYEGINEDIIDGAFNWFSKLEQ